MLWSVTLVAFVKLRGLMRHIDIHKDSPQPPLSYRCYSCHSHMKNIYSNNYLTQRTLVVQHFSEVKMSPPGFGSCVALYRP